MKRSVSNGGDTDRIYSAMKDPKIARAALPKNAKASVMRDNRARGRAPSRTSFDTPMPRRCCEQGQVTPS